MDRQLSVLHICENLSARQCKEIIAQQQSGIQATVLYRHTWHTDLLAFMFRASQFNPITFTTKLAFFEQTHDVIHVMSSLINSRLPQEIRKLLPNKTIVWDLHDWEETKDLQKSIECVDGIIVPSSGIAKRLPTDKPHAVVYSMTPKVLVPEEFLSPDRRIDAIVLSSGIHPLTPGNAIWRQYVEAQVKLKWPMFIYPQTDDNILPKTYFNIMHTIQLPLLLRRIGIFMLGYAGAANSMHTLEEEVSNKFWEYISAGVPVLTYRSSEMTKLALKHGIGFEVEDLEAPIHRAEVALCCARLKEKREQLVMETQLDALNKLYVEAKLFNEKGR